MIIRAMAAALLVGALGLANSNSTFAQGTLGGAKTPQNKIGGAAKPAPVLGGATIRTPSPVVSAKPGPTIATIKPGTPAQATLGTTAPGQTVAAGNVRPNLPPPPTPNQGAKTANLKCASGACTARGVKP